LLWRKDLKLRVYIVGPYSPGELRREPWSWATTTHPGCAWSGPSL
jgi:hypothetical protein